MPARAVRPVPAQQKTPWPFGTGGCERTRCGVRRQVSSRSEVNAFISITIVPRPRAQSRTPHRRAEAEQIAVGVDVRGLPHPEAGIEEIRRLADPRGAPLGLQ